MQYLVSVIDDGQALAVGDNHTASPTEAAAIDDFNERLRVDGHWVFAGGLGMPDSAIVIDSRGEHPVITDGPFVQSRKFVAGFWIMEAPDLDVALRLATDASSACNRKIEVRPFLQ